MIDILSSPLSETNEDDRSLECVPYLKKSLEKLELEV